MEASFAFTVKISAKREAPDVATFDESIAEGAMDEEKGATDGCLAAGRKLTGKVNEARMEASIYILMFFSLRELAITETELKAMAQAAMMGLKWMPKRG